MAGKGGWSPGKDGGKSGSNLTVPGAGGGGGGGDDKPGKEPRKGNVRYSVTPAAGPMQLWVDSLDLLDGGSRSLPVTPNHPPLIGGSARLMPMRSTPNLMAGAASRLGRRSAPNTPFLNLGMESPEQAQLDQIQLAMSGMTPQQLHQHAQWADDMPEIGLTANPRGTPPFMPTNVQGMLRMGQLGIDSGTVTPEMMRLMGAMMGQQDIGYHGQSQQQEHQMGGGGGGRRGGPHGGHHNHHFSHHHQQHQHQQQQQQQQHHDPRGDDAGAEYIRLQVDPRTTLDVPRHHVRFTQRAEAHLRNHGHVGWCQRHHNTGACTFGNGCAFAHVIDSMIQHYRGDAEAAVTANNQARYDNMGKGKGGHMQQHMQHHHNGPMGGGRGRPPPLAGLSGMGWVPQGKGHKGGHNNDDEEGGSRGMWAQRGGGGGGGRMESKGEHQAPNMSGMMNQRGGKGGVSQLSSNAAPFQSGLSGGAQPFSRPARYWSTQQSAPEESVFVGVHEAVNDAIDIVVPAALDDETPDAAKERARTELTQKDSWLAASAWLRKQSWGAAAAVAMDVCVAAGLHQRPVEVLSSKMASILSSCVNGSIRHVDLSLSLMEIAYRAPRDMGIAIAAELKAQAEDLVEVSKLSLNHCELSGNSINIIGGLLPPRVETVELLWVGGPDRFQGIGLLVSELRKREQSSKVRVSCSEFQEAAALVEALSIVAPEHNAPLVEIDVKTKEGVGHEGREMLCSVSVPGLRVMVPTIFIPPVNPTTAPPLPEEVRVLCGDLSYADALAAAMYLSLQESHRVNRVLFRNITTASAPQLSECIQLVLKNGHIQTMELQASKDDWNALQAVLPVLSAQAMKAAGTTKLRNLLIELKDAPEPELLDACLLLPVKHLLITTSCEREALEGALQPFLEKLKKLDPPNLVNVMVDYGNPFGRERGMCRIKGPWSKCQAEWLGENEAQQISDLYRDPVNATVAAAGKNDLPGRFSHVRIAAETLKLPLGEAPALDSVVIDASRAGDLTDILMQEQVRVPNRTTVVVNGGDVTLNQTLTVAGVEFVGANITLDKMVDLVDCVVRGGSIALNGGTLTNCTLVNVTLTATAQATLTGNRFIGPAIELPAGAKGNLVLVQGDVTAVPASGDNTYLPVPTVADMTWHSPSAYFVKKDKAQNDHVALAPIAGGGAARLITYANLAHTLAEKGLAVARPVGFGCDDNGESVWVRFATGGPSLGANPAFEWSIAGKAKAAAVGIETAIKAVSEASFVHGAVSQENIFVAGKRWILGPASQEVTGDAAKDAAAVEDVVAWAAAGCSSSPRS